MWLTQEGEQITMSHNVSGGPNDVNAVDLQVRLHVLCNKSSPSVSLSPPLLCTFGKMWAGSQQRETFITAFKMMEPKALLTVVMPT